MAMKRISDLDAAVGALAGTEQLEIETAGGVSKKVTAQAIADLSNAAVAPAGFQFSAETGSIADAAPGDGKLTWNNATQASATIIYIDDDTADAIALTGLWANLTAGGFLFLHAPSDATKWQAWKVTNVNDATGYAKLTVTLLAKGADFADGDALRVGAQNGGAAGTGPKITTTVTSNTITPDADTDLVRPAALTAGLTIANPSGTPADGAGFVVDLIDNGTTRALTWGSKYANRMATLPNTTTVSKRHRLGFEYNAADDKLYCMYSAVEP